MSWVPNSADTAAMSFGCTEFLYRICVVERIQAHHLLPLLGDVEKV